MSVAAPTDAIGSGALFAVRADAAYPPASPIASTAVAAIAFMSASWRHYATPNRAASPPPRLPAEPRSDFRRRRTALPRDRRRLRAVVVLPRRTLPPSAVVAGRRDHAHCLRRLRPAILAVAGAWRPDV